MKKDKIPRKEINYLKTLDDALDVYAKRSHRLLEIYRKGVAKEKSLKFPKKVKKLIELVRIYEQLLSRSFRYPFRDIKDVRASIKSYKETVNKIQKLCKEFEE